MKERTTGLKATAAGAFGVIVSLLATISLAAFAVAPGWILNQSVTTVCAEEDNVNVPVYLPDASRFWIVATHPAYCPCVYDFCPADFSQCAPGKGGLPDDCGTQDLWNDGINVIRVCTVADWWRGRTMDVVVNGTRKAGHYLQYYRKIADALSWPQFLVFYQDGNLRLKPHPPTGVDDVCFGSSVVVGPVTQGDRPYADILEIRIDTTDGSLDVTYVTGGTAHIDLHVDRDQASAGVFVNYAATSDTPAATFRSMYVTEDNCDAARIHAVSGDSPILGPWTRLDGTWWRFYRETESRHNQSGPDFAIVLDTAAMFRVEQTGAVLADGAFYGSAFLTGFADIAEWVRVTEPVQPGDVLELDPTQPGSYRMARGLATTLVAGVVSTEPGLVLGSPTHYLPPTTNAQALLALSGIVPVKVTNEGGPIQSGDLLVSSSTPGCAMRWDGVQSPSCSFIGKALGGFDGEYGTVVVLLMTP
jgi:hypothetical protein